MGKTDLMIDQDHITIFEKKKILGNIRNNPVKQEVW